MTPCIVRFPNNTKYFKVNDYAVNMNGISENGSEKNCKTENDSEKKHKRENSYLQLYSAPHAL